MVTVPKSERQELMEGYMAGERGMNVRHGASYDSEADKGVRESSTSRRS